MSVRCCEIPGCDREHFARGWCRNHYERWKRNGDPMLSLRGSGPCRIEGCDKPRIYKDLCKSHYRRWKKYGDPLGQGIIGSVRQDPIERLLRKVERVDDCWVWQGGRRGTYGHFWLDGKGHLAHRVAYELFVGPIPAGLTLDHLCKNRLCVNSEHLEPITIHENILRSDSISARNSRKTHCPQGHPYATFAVRYRNRRYCGACVPSLIHLVEHLQ